MKPLVSVIIPTYNRQQHIKNAVESVLGQTYKNVEVLVVDDGSTDSTPEIMNSIHDERLKYIRTKNQGNYFARNAGLAQAKGDFIAFLDSDDRFLPTKLTVQIQRFEENPELGLCCSNVYVRHQDIDNQVFEDAAHSFNCDIDTQNGFIQKAVENNFIVTSSVVIRKECVKNLGYFNTQFQNAMDYEFFLRIIFNYPALYLKEKLLVRLIHPRAVSSNTVVTNDALVYIFSECVAKLEKGKMYSQIHRELLNDAKEKSLYMSGMEYLLQYRFDDAIVYLKKTEFRKKIFFKHIALVIAKYKISILIPLIAQYRKYKNYSSLHRNPVVRSDI